MVGLITSQPDHHHGFYFGLKLMSSGYQAMVILFSVKAKRHGASLQSYLVQFSGMVCEWHCTTQGKWSCFNKFVFQFLSTKSKEIKL